MKRVFTKKFLNYDDPCYWSWCKMTCREARLCVSLLREYQNARLYLSLLREYQKRRTAVRLYRTNVTNPLSS